MQGPIVEVQDICKLMGDNVLVKQGKLSTFGMLTKYSFERREVKTQKKRGRRKKLEEATSEVENTATETVVSEVETSVETSSETSSEEVNTPPEYENSSVIIIRSDASGRIKTYNLSEVEVYKPTEEEEGRFRTFVDLVGQEVYFWSRPERSGVLKNGLLKTLTAGRCVLEVTGIAKRDTKKYKAGDETKLLSQVTFDQLVKPDQVEDEKAYFESLPEEKRKATRKAGQKVAKATKLDMGLLTSFVPTTTLPPPPSVPINATQPSVPK